MLRKTIECLAKKYIDQHYVILLNTQQCTKRCDFLWRSIRIGGTGNPVENSKPPSLFNMTLDPSRNSCNPVSNRKGSFHCEMIRKTKNVLS
jgi:hypothetical protein